MAPSFRIARPKSVLASHSRRARGVFVSALLGLVLAPGLSVASGLDTPRSVGVVIYDAAIERPVGLVETLVGTAVTAVAWPLALGSGRTNEVVDRCIARPARYTFGRALGDFSQRPANDCGAFGLSWGVVRAALALAERPLAFVFGRSPLEPTAPEPQDELEIDGPSAWGPPRQREI
jgi:hypothetical protein